jgi:hypothetical protein
MSVQKEVVSVAEMAAMVELSRSRFYDLIDEGIFPPPMRDEATGRPFYSRELQEQCLDVRHRNCGVNGKPVMFYAKRAKAPQSKSSKTAANDQNADLTNGQKSAKLNKVLKKMNAAMAQLAPHGAKDVDGKALRELYRTIRHQEFGG